MPATYAAPRLNGRTRTNSKAPARRRTLKSLEAELQAARDQALRFSQRGRRMTERWRRLIRAEVANSVTHGIGAGLALAGLSVLAVIAAEQGGAWKIVGVSIYGVAMVLLYLASTLYHSIAEPRAKRLFRILDHSAIYLAIAGTYTPFVLTHLRGPWGWTLFGIVWGLALIGIVIKAFYVGKYDAISTAVYVLMGWMAVAAWQTVVDSLPAGALYWIVAGGLAYTAGVLFYAWERLPYNHAIWHGFVLAGSILHYIAVLRYVALPV